MSFPQTRCWAPLHAVPRAARQIHVTRVCRDLVGPNHPVSNIRPVIYDDAASTSRGTNHPYSLGEFKDKASESELQWRMQKQQLDAFNHAFWLDSNTRFEAGRQSALASLPPDATPLAKENALSEFYGTWVIQEAPSQRRYNEEWRRRNFSGIVIAGRVYYNRIVSRATALFSSDGSSA